MALFLTAALAIALLYGLVAVARAYKIATYVDPFTRKVAEAGYVLKTAQVNQVTFSYAEGPDNGPPLVLLHAQHLDWFSYSRVLPALAKSFHVYDIDYPGHGSTRVAADYPMTGSRIGTDLAAFIAQQIGHPVYVTGNSSGGLLVTWLAANRPDLIRAAVLEDPPLFSAEYPRIRQTVADRSFETSRHAVQDHTEDFLLYWIHANAGIFRKQVAPGVPFLLTQAVRVYRATHPGKPAEIGLLRNDTVRMLVRGLDEYDPRFGAAFHDGTWNEGFSHAEALTKITCPVLLMQANIATLPDGTRYGAMSRQEAQRAMSLLPDGQYLKIDASHVINLDRPEAFVSALENFLVSKNRLIAASPSP